MKAKTICIVQLTRAGDIIQTCQAVHAAKIEHPELNFVLVARKTYLEGLEFLTEQLFEKVHALDTADIFKKDNLIEAKKNISNFTQEVNQHDFDLVVNLSYSNASAYLCSLIKSNNKAGIVMNRQNRIEVTDTWSQFVYATILNGKYCPFNLVDIFKNVIGVKAVTNVFPINDEPKAQIVIHPFASQKKKSWGHSKWVEVIYQLVKNNKELDIVIVGAPNEREDSEKITNSTVLQKFGNRIINTVGKTTIEQTFLLTRESKLFIGHDSLVSHLAALSSVPSVIISLGIVKPYETTPYSDSVINLTPNIGCFPCNLSTECELLPCHAKITQQAVTYIAGKLYNQEQLDSSEMKKDLSPFVLSGINAYFSSFNEHGMDLLPLYENDLETNQIMDSFYRVLWNFYFNQNEVPAKVPYINDTIANNLLNTLEGIKNLFELNGFASRFASDIIRESDSKDLNIHTIKDLSTKLQEVDQLAQITAKTFPLLSPIVNFFYVSKANSQGRNIVELAKESIGFYQDFNNLLSVLFELIEQSTKGHKKVKDSASNDRSNQQDC
jgi:ADP-heptose:LPS heptosyltransferase